MLSMPTTPSETPLPGLSLAGDYTAQAFVVTMEGAVVSGHRAATAARKTLDNRIPAARREAPTA